MSLLVFISASSYVINFLHVIKIVFLKTKMIICYILCTIFFIPIIHSNVTTSSKVNQTVKSSLNTNDSWKNTTKLSINRENSSTMPDKSALTSKDNITVDFLKLEEGFGKLKEKPVHARKGVNPLDDLDSKNSIPVDLNTLDKDVSTALNKTQSDFKELASNTVANLNQHKENKDIRKKIEEGHMITTEKGNKKPKKPNKTVYETLASLGQGPVTVKTSPHTLVLDQIPSPNRDASVGQNPGMITPIVITILVVPMFAVLGYMALRRGQEAWKNRHYKRMDFLLDGMYND